MTLTEEQALAAASLVAGRYRTEYPQEVNVAGDTADLAARLRYDDDVALPERVGTRADVEAEIRRLAAAMGLDRVAADGALATALLEHMGLATASPFGVLGYGDAMDLARQAAMQAALAAPGNAAAC
jgi:hypothetical protein